MSRIIAGELGGRRLRTPPGDRTRPTTDRVREALFSRIESLLGSLTGTTVLDLYAGSGAVGLEAVSRGAAFALLVESDRRALAAARANVDALGVGGRVQVVGDRVERLLARPAADVLRTGVGADVVFADPPYAVGTDAVRAVLDAAVVGGWFAGDALLVVERPTRGAAGVFPVGVVAGGERRYGETTLWYGHRGSLGPADPAGHPAGHPADHPAEVLADHPTDGDRQ